MTNPTPHSSRDSATSIARAVAEAAVNPVGFLALPYVTDLDPGAGCELSFHAGTLSLSGLRSLSPPVARELGRHCDWLFLDGVESLDEPTAKRLAYHRGGLSLRGLTTLAPKVAVALAATQGDLHLNGLRALDPEAAWALASLRDTLVLDGLDTVTPATLTALARHTGGLSLGGLRSIDVPQAEALAMHCGRLWLDGLRELPEPIAAVLARHERGISLAGLVGVDGSLPESVALLASPDLERLRATADGPGSTSDDPIRFVKPAREVESLGVAIIGGGFSGIAMAIRLLESGRHDVTILEKASSLGGTWRDNTYPGCACDVPSRLYSYSFATDTNWSRDYASQPEILAYIERVAGQHDIHAITRFGTAIEQLVWDKATSRWEITATDGRRFSARVVVSAVGGIHIPNVPDISGLDHFAGSAFHSARWQHDLDLTGRRVAVIGTGASAIQIVPAIADKVDRLTVFQRTAPWILPRGERPISRTARWLDDHVPGMRAIRRQWLYWAAEARAIPLTRAPRLVVHPQRKVKTYMLKCIRDHRLRCKLEPSYALGCKRVLKSDDYYQAVDRGNVEVVAEPIDHIGQWDVTTIDGIVRPLDVVVLATGFKPFDITDAVDVIGRNGRSLAEAWQNGPEAYHGIAVAGFPNLFLLMGPNTALGHNSILVMIEAQVNYVLQCLGWLERGDLPSVEVTAEAQTTFNASLDERFDRSVWRNGPVRGTGGASVAPCGSWYVHASGRNHVLWPGGSASYLSAVRRPDISAFRSTADAPTVAIPKRAAA